MIVIYESTLGLPPHFHGRENVVTSVNGEMRFVGDGSLRYYVVDKASAVMVTMMMAMPSH